MKNKENDKEIKNKEHDKEVKPKEVIPTPVEKEEQVKKEDKKTDLETNKTVDKKEEALIYLRDNVVHGQQAHVDRINQALAK